MGIQAQEVIARLKLQVDAKITKIGNKRPIIIIPTKKNLKT